MPLPKTSRLGQIAIKCLTSGLTLWNRRVPGKLSASGSQPWLHTAATWKALKCQRLSPLQRW